MNLGSSASTAVLAVACLLFVAQANPLTEIDTITACPNVIARIPPSLNGTVNQCFTNTPTGYFQGRFYQTYSSAANIQALKNVWLDTTQDSTTGGNDDVTSYQVPGCSHVYTSYSNNSFPGNDVFPFHLGGYPASSTFLQELIAYERIRLGMDTS
ncbi:hypothetical protein MMC13_007085 [Lambiella insularis]|nr:hypothetical protein [Lambiella insularis]